jgi:WD40 repeat protein
MADLGNATAPLPAKPIIPSLKYGVRKISTDSWYLDNYSFSPNGLYIICRFIKYGYRGQSPEIVTIWKISDGSLIRVHVGPVGGFGFTGDDSYYLIGLKEISCWRIDEAKLLLNWKWRTTFKGHACTTSCFGGGVLALSEGDHESGIFGLYKLSDGTKLLENSTFMKQTKATWLASAISQDGSCLAATDTEQKEIYFWDLLREGPPRSLSLSNKTAQVLAFSKDGEYLFAGGTEGEPGGYHQKGFVSLISVRSGAIVRSTSTTRSVNSISVCSDQERIILDTDDDNSPPILLNSGDLSTVATFKDIRGHPVFSPNGTWLGLGGQKEVSILPAAESTSKLPLNTTEYAESILTSFDMIPVLRNLELISINIEDVDSSFQSNGLLTPGKRARIRLTLCNTNRKRIIHGLRLQIIGDKNITLQKSAPTLTMHLAVGATVDVVAELDGPLDMKSINESRFFLKERSEDRELIVTIPRFCGATWRKDKDEGRPSKSSRQIPINGLPNKPAIAPYGRFLLIGDNRRYGNPEGNHIGLFDSLAGRRVLTFREVEGVYPRILVALPNPSGNYIATLSSVMGFRPPPIITFLPNGGRGESYPNEETSFPRRVRLWRVSDAAPVWMADCLASAEGPMAFTPDAMKLAMGGTDGIIRLWNCEDGSNAGTIDAGGLTISALAFTPNGSSIVIGSNDGSIKFIPANGIGQVIAIPAHDEPVSNLVISPDGTWLASSSESEIRIWRISDQRCVYSIILSNKVNQLAFSPDSKILAEWETSNITRFWKVGQDWEPKGSCRIESPIPPTPPDWIMLTRGVEAFWKDGSIERDLNEHVYESPSAWPNYNNYRLWANPTVAANRIYSTFMLGNNIAPQIDDSGAPPLKGNGNGELDPGETILVKAVLSNGNGLGIGIPGSSAKMESALPGIHLEGVRAQPGDWTGGGRCKIEFLISADGNIKIPEKYCIGVRLSSTGTEDCVFPIQIGHTPPKSNPFP